MLDLYGPDVTKPGTFAANCLLGAAAGRARRAVHPALPPGLGPARQPAARHPHSGQETDQPSAGLLTDLKRRGLLGRHAGHLGRRVRPHQLLAGQAHGRQLRPRPSPALLHRSGWPAAACGRASPTARPTPTATTSPTPTATRSARPSTSHAGRGPRPRSAGDDPAPVGHRPRAALLQVPGPPLPPDRRARHGGPRRAGVRQVSLGYGDDFWRRAIFLQGGPRLVPKVPLESKRVLM